MNKFFMRKEAALIPALAAGAGIAGAKMLRNADKSGYTPGTGVTQALPTYNPGQPSWWEKPYYALQRGVAKLPVRVQKALKVAGGGVMGLPNPFGGIDNKPKSRMMFNPKDNPEAYHAELYNMAKAREERIREAAIPAYLRHGELFEEIQKNPWRSIRLGPYERRANRRANMLHNQLLDAGGATLWIGKPGSLEANNTIEDIKYGKPTK